jgi:hypothetical protein
MILYHFVKELMHSLQTSLSDLEASRPVKTGGFASGRSSAAKLDWTVPWHCGYSLPCEEGGFLIIH